MGLKAVIFDVDDTLLDNQSPPWPLHERSRFDAIMSVADKYNLPMLETLTHQENLDSFLTAKSHSVEGAVWNVLYQKGLVDSEELDLEHATLHEIVAHKESLHAKVLRQYGKEVVGASAFVHLLAQNGITNLAIASTANPRDIDIFLDEMTDLRQFFPPTRIISKADIPHAKTKPHPEPFDRAFRLLELPDRERRNVLAVEDDPRGVMSAKAAGLYVAAITTRFARDHPQLLAAQPDVVVGRYDELARHLGLVVK